MIFLLTHLTPLSTTCKNTSKKTVKVYCLRSLRPTPSPVFRTQRTVLSAVPATVSVWFHTANDCALFTVPPLFFAGSHYYCLRESTQHTHTNRQVTDIIFLFGLICQASLIQWQCLKMKEHEESDSQRS